MVKTTEKKKPKGTIRLSEFCVEKTTQGKDSTGFVQMTTKIGKVKHGWATCGGCNQYVTNCSCKGGVIHPPALEWFLIRERLKAEGSESYKEAHLVRDHHDVQRHAIYWYLPQRPGANRGSGSLHDLIDRTISARKPNRGHTAFPRVRRNSTATMRKPSLLGAEVKKRRIPRSVEFGGKPVGDPNKRSQRVDGKPRKPPKRPSTSPPEIDTQKVDASAQTTADDRLSAIYDKFEKVKGLDKPKKGKPIKKRKKR